MNMASGQIKAPSAAEIKAEPGPTEDEITPSVPRLDSQIAKMALHGFQPFTADPAKQARYIAYLKAQAAGEDSVPFQQLPGQNSDSFKRELEDYARSAQIFKPVSGAMAGRFARASVVETGPQAVEGLHKPENEGSYLTKPSAEEKEPVKEESPKENAARLGMYGALTREVKPWIPAKLLCKRFGVKEPQVELPAEMDDRNARSTSQWQSGEVLAITDGLDAGLEGSTKISDGKEDTDVSKPSRPKERDLSNIGYGDEDETQGRDILTYQKPSMDIFKAIFASDEEDEADGDDNTEDVASALQNGHEGPSNSVVKNDSTPDAPSGSRQGASTSTVSMNTVKPEEVNIDTFKPKFVPRANRETKGEEKGEKDRTREKKKKKGKTLVSFDLDEGGESAPGTAHEKEREKKKRKKEKRKESAKGESG